MPTRNLVRGLLKMTTNNSAVVMVGTMNPGPQGYVGTRAMTATDMAWQKFCQDRPDMFPWAVNNGTYNLNHFQFGQRLQMTFEFNFTDVISITQTLEEKNMSEFKDITMNELPDDFMKQFQQTYDQYNFS